MTALATLGFNFLITNVVLLGFGATDTTPAGTWTDISPVSGAWTGINPETGTWTPVSPVTGTWSEL